ncbi:MAG TPA: PHB depolymerase family esterase [Candidatus Dormibacteraeota bacterium]|nr:PHB depolymerase family esterase [Candidatus Dormibacteraeota bacterium]
MRTLLVAALLSAMTACGTGSVAQRPSPAPAQSPTPAASLHNESLTVDGVMRTYHLFVPSSLQPGQPAPLVIILHPCPATGAQAAVGSHLNDVATANHFVVVYPDGAVMAATGGTCWNAGTCCTGADDVSFIGQLIDRLTARLQLDRARVFVAGFSFGAAMAYRLGCQLSDRVTAIASVSGALVFSGCHPAQPVSVLIMQGTADTNFPYQGGGDYSVPSVATVARLWATLDGCAGAGAQSTTGIVARTQWNSCRAGATVRLEVIAGAPHTWFGHEPNPIPGEPDASSEMWDFFNGIPPRA